MEFSGPLFARVTHDLEIVEVTATLQLPGGNKSQPRVKQNLVPSVVEMVTDFQVCSEGETATVFCLPKQFACVQSPHDRPAHVVAVDCAWSSVGLYVLKTLSSKACVFILLCF